MPVSSHLATNQLKINYKYTKINWSIRFYEYVLNHLLIINTVSWRMPVFKFKCFREIDINHQYELKATYCNLKIDQISKSMIDSHLPIKHGLGLVL